MIGISTSTITKGVYSKDGYQEFKSLGILAVPIIIANLLTFSQIVVNVAMVGHLGADELGGVALANLTFNMIHYPLSGMLTAFDTLLTQSYGAKNYRAFAEWFRTGTIVLLGFTLVACIFLGNVKPIFDALNQDPKIAHYASNFCKILIPGYPPMILFLCFQRYLQSQHIMAPSVYIGLVTNIYNAIANYLCIYYWNMGVNGAALAVSSARVFQLIAMIIYLKVKFTKHHKTWPELKWPQNFANISSRFLQLGGPGAIMIGLEAWTFEVSSLLATYLSTKTLDAHTILISTCGLTYMSFPFALGIASTIRIGNHLGHGDWKEAVMASKICYIMMVALQLCFALFYFTAGEYIGRIYTDDQEVIALVGSVSYVAGLFQVFDGLQTANAGVLRGMGRQTVVAILNFVGFWIIGTPLGAVLAFQGHLKLTGLWWGLCIGLIVCSSIGVLYVSKIDFSMEAALAQERIAYKSDEIESDEPLSARESAVGFQMVEMDSIQNEFDFSEQDDGIDNENGLGIEEKFAGEFTSISDDVKNPMRQSN